MIKTHTKTSIYRLHIMSDAAVNNKRIAKNTLFLYFRTILIMLVTLYTSRVVLNTLGEGDYGVYNAVGGMVLMFTVISGALSNAISRYITYGLGERKIENLKVIFCTSVNIQIVLAILVLILCEALGVWFLNNKMTIPQDRLVAANWVLQCSLLSFVVNLISVPYNACIIAHEHMSAYAYISIFDAILKLSVAFLLITSPFDKLIAYSVLLLITAIVVRFLYGIYCGKHFEECHYKPIYDKSLFKEMLGFAGWNFFGNATSILNSQGINLLINIFFGVLANSARGIASQVDAAVNQFVTTFTTAVNPQITKSYAQGDKSRMFYLICKGAKFSYLLLLFFAIPIFFEADRILEIWLINVPENAPLFVRLSILGAMVTVLGNTGYTACMATGNIKTYSTWITLVGSMAFFLTWVVYKLGAPVESAYIVYIGVYIVVQIVRLILMRRLLGFSIILFVKDVVAPISFATILSLIVPWLISSILAPSALRVLFTFVLATIWTALCSFLTALTKGERITLVSKGKAVIGKVFKTQI